MPMVPIIPDSKNSLADLFEDKLLPVCMINSEKRILKPGLLRKRKQMKERK